MNKTQKGFAVIETLLILVVVAIIGGTGYYVWHSKSTVNKSLNNVANTSLKTPAKTAIKSYDECIKSPGSIEQETYPPVCVTKSGQRFTQSSSTSANSSAVIYSDDCQNQSNQYLVINNWNVRIKLTNQISDAGCVVGSDNPDAINFTAQVFKTTTCSQGWGSLGSISRYLISKIDSDSANAPHGTTSGPAKIGSYYYYFTMPQSACSTYEPIQASATADAVAFKNAFQTLETTQ